MGSNFRFESGEGVEGREARGREGAGEVEMVPLVRVGDGVRNAGCNFLL
jgi:hypothetical protein